MKDSCSQTLATVGQGKRPLEECRTTVGSSSFTSAHSSVMPVTGYEGWAERPLTVPSVVVLLLFSPLPFRVRGLCLRVQLFPVAHPYHLSGEQSPSSCVPRAQ